MLDIQNIKAVYNDNKVVFTQHFMYRIDKRGIMLPDIRSAVNAGEIIEQYPDDYPHPSALIFGHTKNGEPIHIVTGLGDGLVWLVTAYYPDNIKWEDDYKTRKAAK